MGLKSPDNDLTLQPVRLVYTKELKRVVMIVGQYFIEKIFHSNKEGIKSE